jgi:Protein of unknown function (DUF4199)
MQTTTTQIALKWGAIAGIAIIIGSTIGYLFNLQTNTTYTTISSIVYTLILPIIFLILAMREYKANNNTFMTYSQGIGIGAMMGGIAGLLSGIYTFIYIKFFDPTLMEKAKDVQMAKLEEQGLSSEQIEQSMQIMSIFSSPGMAMVSSILGFIFIFFVISLIVSAVQKHEKPIFE